MKKLLLLAIQAYSYLVSPFMPSCCRFYPSCSSYATEAIERHGILKGVFLTLGRLSKCHPFHEGGCDPVP